jgi:hypothetical protein
LPEAAHHEEQATGFEHWIGLVRPFALGELGSATPTLTAVVRRDVLSLPLLTCDAAAAAAYEEAFDARAGARQAWQRFVVEDGLGELAGSARDGSRAPQTALAPSALECCRSPRAASRVRLTHWTMSGWEEILDAFGELPQMSAALDALTGACSSRT